MTQLNEPGSTGQPVTEQVAVVKDQAQEKVQQWGSQIQEQTRTQVDARSTQIGEQVGSSADALRSAGHDLTDKGHDAPARAMQAAAEGAERIGEYLRSSDYDRMLADVERYARANPWAVVTSGVVVGLAASRFLKSSSARRSQAAASPRIPIADTRGPESGIVVASPAADLAMDPGLSTLGSTDPQEDVVEPPIVTATHRDVSPAPGPGGGY